MDVKVFAVRVGNRYGREYEEYLRSKIPHIQFLNEEKEEFKLQWNKLHFFNLDLDKPIVVIDIDLELINDYEKLFEYKIKEDEFLTIKPWWNSKNINGGFYKFYPKQFKYVYNEFKNNKEKWEQYYIHLGLKPGPVNGEEDFVADQVADKLVYLPEEWCALMYDKGDKEWFSRINAKYPGDYFYLGNKFNPNIKLVHYLGLNSRTNSIEKS
jgi:hypothetical protein